MDGDRFFFTHNRQKGGFTPEAKKILIKRNLGGVICDNTDITNVPANVFKYQSSENFVDCGQIAKLDENVIEELLKGGTPIMKSKTTNESMTTSKTVTRYSSESDCDHWASQGYCINTFATWMIANCKEACDRIIKRATSGAKALNLMEEYKRNGSTL